MQGHLAVAAPRVPWIPRLRDTTNDKIAHIADHPFRVALLEVIVDTRHEMPYDMNSFISYEFYGVAYRCFGSGVFGRRLRGRLLAGRALRLQAGGAAGVS